MLRGCFLDDIRPSRNSGDDRLIRFRTECSGGRSVSSVAISSTLQTHNSSKELDALRRFAGNKRLVPSLPVRGAPNALVPANANAAQNISAVRLAADDGTDWAGTSETLSDARPITAAIARASHRTRTYIGNDYAPTSQPAAAATPADSFADLKLRKPITGIADCCACAASGQAAAEAVIALMKSRRRTRPSSERLRTTPVLKAYQIRAAMSALGQKRTSRSVEGMSALPPKADIGYAG